MFDKHLYTEEKVSFALFFPLNFPSHNGNRPPRAWNSLVQGKHITSMEVAKRARSVYSKVFDIIKDLVFLKYLLSVNVSRSE